MWSSEETPLAQRALLQRKQGVEQLVAPGPCCGFGSYASLAQCCPFSAASNPFVCQLETHFGPMEARLEMQQDWETSKAGASPICADWGALRLDSECLDAMTIGTW